jgi:hypothetical protein
MTCAPAATIATVPAIGHEMARFREDVVPQCYDWGRETLMDFIVNMLTGPLALAAGFALIAFAALRRRRLRSEPGDKQN